MSRVQTKENNLRKPLFFLSSKENFHVIQFISSEGKQDRVFHLRKIMSCCQGKQLLRR